MLGNCGVSELLYIIKLKELIVVDFFYQIYMEYNNLFLLVEVKVMIKVSNLDIMF